MNIGQVLETHLGWVAKTGWEVEGDDAEWKKQLRAIEAHESPKDSNVATPRSSTVRARRRSRVCSSRHWSTGTVTGWSTATARPSCSNGRSGEPLPDPISVGYVYILKLNHLVERQDPRAVDRPVLDDHAAAAGR